MQRLKEKTDLRNERERERDGEERGREEEKDFVGHQALS